MRQTPHLSTELSVIDYKWRRSQKLGVDRQLPIICDIIFALASAGYDRMRALLDRRQLLTNIEAQELDSLIDAELDATVLRANALGLRHTT